MSPWIDPKTKSRSFLSSWLVINLRDSQNHVIERVILPSSAAGNVWSTLVFHSPSAKHLGHRGPHFVLVPGVWWPHLAISFLFPLLCFIEVKLYLVKMHTSYTYNWMSFDNSNVDTHVPTPKSRKSTFLSPRKSTHISLRPTSHPETILSLLLIHSLTDFHVVSPTPTGCSHFIFFYFYLLFGCATRQVGS